MARLLTCGWETASACEAVVQNNFTNLTVQTTPTRNSDSLYSMKIPSTMASGAVGFEYQPNPAHTAASTDTWYARFYMYFTAAPTAANAFFSINSGSTASWSTTGVAVQLNTDQTLTLLVNNVAQTPTSAALSLSAWNMIEVRAVTGTSGSAGGELRVNGTSVVSVTASTGATAAFTQCQFGSSVATARGVDIYIDDFALNDQSGTAQNTFVGDSNLKLLLPVSDNAIGTGWTTSGGATTSLFTNVDNMPPTGIADTTASEGHQIRNATSNANSAYDANIQSYSAAGIASGATINLVHTIVAVAAPVSTSAKQGTIGCVSNPAGTIDAIVASAGTAGAFWGGVAAGTYATGWKTSHSSPVYGDIAAGSRSTSPVVRVNQVTSSTRIAMCCLLGLYVDYTPATASPPVGEQVIISAQAVRRAAFY